MKKKKERRIKKERKKNYCSPRGKIPRGHPRVSSRKTVEVNPVVNLLIALRLKFPPADLSLAKRESEVTLTERRSSSRRKELDMYPVNTSIVSDAIEMVTFGDQLIPPPERPAPNGAEAEGFADPWRRERRERERRSEGEESRA